MGLIDGHIFRPKKSKILFNCNPDVLCDHHLECNDPVTRCFLLAKTCSDLADEDSINRAEYRDDIDVQ